MIQLLFTVILVEAALILPLSFRTPFRKLVLMGLDQVKRGRGPVMVKTVAATVFVVMMSTVYSMMSIQKRGIEDGVANPTDQVLMAKHLLEATLMGAILFLALMIDRLHHYIRELRMRRKTMETANKQNRSSDDLKANGSVGIKALEEEIRDLKSKSKELEADLETKKTEIHAAEASAVALRKQSEGFLLEYDRLLEENQILRNQLQNLDHKLSRSPSKKNT